MGKERSVFDLKNRIAIVTGGNGGIGLGMARGLARAGAHVVVAGRNAAKSADAVRELERVGGQASSVTVDVADEVAVSRLMESVRTRHGRLDILINNAGLYASLEMRPFTEIPLEEWRQVMDVNVASMFLMAREVVPVMRARGGGRIVNISSGTPFRGVPFLLHYVTSKGAIVAFTRALAKELGKDGILVNCVAPGFTMSAGVEAHPEVIEKLRDVSIGARTIQRDQLPEDVVGAVVYLCGPGSAFVTGQTIVIDGGQYFH
jgi:NAD(P)-dependent dehydrogenase (short-subunit alcohol dehydrogenase family)